MPAKPKARDSWTVVGPLIYGEGDLPTKLAFFGEAPGRWESIQQRPFVGKSGNLLRSILLRLGFSSGDYYISNVFKRRPVDGSDKDRPPTAEELYEHSGYLADELSEVCRGGVIVCLGLSAARAILGPDHIHARQPMEAIHGLPIAWNGRTLIAAYHPAAGLRKPRWMVDFYHDMIAVKQAIEGKLSPTQPHPRKWVFGLNRRITFDSRIMGADTEGNGKIAFCASASTRPWDATVVRAGDANGLATLKLQIEGCSKVVAHYWQGVDIGNFESLNIKVRDDQLADTFVQAHCLQNEPLGLKDLARRHFGEDLTDYSDFVKPWHRKAIIETLKHKAGSDVDKPTARALVDLEAGRTVSDDRLERVLGYVPRYGLEVVPESEWISYSAKDTVCLPLYHVLAPKVTAMGLDEIVALDTASIPSLYRMQQVGLPLDPRKVEALKTRLTADRATLLAEFRTLARVDETFSPTSPEQVADLLFSRLRLKPLHRTDSGQRWSTDAKTLESLQGKHPAVDSLLRFRKNEKLLTSFVPELLSAGDRLRFEWGAPTVTGRSTSEMILMMPRRGPLGKATRCCFVAPPGKVFVSADFSQLEVRVMADESQDKAMLELIRKGHDFHQATADMVLKTGNRENGKILNFAIQYDATEWGIYKQAQANRLPWSMQDCAEFRSGWMMTYSGVKKFLSAMHAEARRYGYVRDRWGRIRYCPSVWADDQILRGEGEREAGNFPIQAGGLGTVKRAQVRVWRDVLPDLRRNGIEIEMLLQIHDDLLFLADEDAVRAGVVIPPIVEAMVADSDKFSVPITVEVKVGKSWGEMEVVHWDE